MPRSSGLRIEELLSASAYPHAVTRLTLKQTHLSWVVLTGGFAYKLKKPVRFDFVDASTLERRRHLCQEELRLNRRFAPELYLDVVPITREAGRLKVGGSGEPLEYAVRMREFAEAQELGSRLERDAVTPQDIAALGGLLADTHAGADPASADGPFGSLQTVRQPMLDNFSLLRARMGNGHPMQRLARLEAWTLHSLSELEPVIEARRRSGRVRECHGDLHARNIVWWQSRWLPFDCLEFDSRLRWIDVMSDAAYLYMDLVSRSREDLASCFLNRYLEVNGDYEGLRLLHLYCSYRALVRAKVDALWADSAGPRERVELEGRLAHRLAAAMRFLDAEQPFLILMHGVTASGKSWLSERLIGAVPAIRVRSDLERKRLAGVEELAHRSLAVGAGSYAPDVTQRTYDRLLACADAALEGRCSIIVDATFLELRDRAAFHSLALRRRCPFLIVSCVADPATLARRLDRRELGGHDPSEATREVLADQLKRRQPLDAAETPMSLEVDTGSDPTFDRIAGQIRRRLGRVP
jgi:aminoglycoside phosphotransferase family enzyme/predicted kinase